VSTSDQTILVTGGAGYIGSHLTRLLIEAGYRVRVLDVLCYGGDSLSPLHSSDKFELINADIRNREAVVSALKGVSGVVHLAAIVGDPSCASQPELAREVNKVAAEMLCDEAIKAGVSRFVFASTCSNYGKMADHNGYVDEDSPLAPISLYAELKVGFEKYLTERTSDNFTPVCLRFATAFGLSPRMRFDLTVNEFTREIVLGRRLEVFGEEFWRPYCHASDLARACVLALQADRELVAGKAFNVGESHGNFQKLTLVKIILETLGRGYELVRFVSRKEDPRDYRVKFSKIYKTLGFTVSRTVPQGVREIIDALESKQFTNPDDPNYRNV
jgi:nucleoside-diphosphate-sugar epimerase